MLGVPPERGDAPRAAAADLRWRPAQTWTGGDRAGAGKPVTWRLDSTAMAGILCSASLISMLFQTPTLNTVIVSAAALFVASLNQYARPLGK